MKKTIYSEKSKKLQELLIEARLNAGMTQQQLAAELKKPQSFVAKYEGGERRLDVIEFIEICKSLKIDSKKLISTIDS